MQNSCILNQLSRLTFPWAIAIGTSGRESLRNCNTSSMAVWIRNETCLLHRYFKRPKCIAIPTSLNKCASSQIRSGASLVHNILKKGNHIMWTWVHCIKEQQHGRSWERIAAEMVTNELDYWRVQPYLKRSTSSNRIRRGQKPEHPLYKDIMYLLLSQARTIKLFSPVNLSSQLMSTNLLQTCNVAIFSTLRCFGSSRFKTHMHNYNHGLTGSTKHVEEVFDKAIKTSWH